MIPLFQFSDVRFGDFLTYPDITLAEQRCTFIMGQSGCGKSTLLRLLNSLVSPSRGTIQYRGENLATLDTLALRRNVLLCPQDVFLFEGSISENFSQYFGYRDAPCPSEETMQQFLQLCCLSLPLTARCETLSGGERQRVLLAICLSFLPQVLLLDEPTAALDEATAQQVLADLKLFCSERQITLIIVCHNPRLAELYADETVLLEKEAAK